ncbi:Centrosomal protein of 78 kDa [Gryllus bimaculatus]|nr:Centrosomal protein of 78 kDa [Gryllus bimaculatus]
MFQSVKDRRKNSPFFYKFYPDVCQLRNIAPLSFSKYHVHKNILDINGDKISIDEWLAILEALKNDRSLHVIAVRSRHPVKKILEDVDTETKVRLVKKFPVLYTKFVLRSLMASLAECITESSLVTCIEIEGLPLKHEYMAILSKGMMANSSLQTISFHNSPLGNEVFKQLTMVLRNMPIIFHLDLSNCNLSSKSAIEVAETLKSLQHYTEGWKQSLRNHDPELESMCGLRRIILNNNPGIGDDGVKHLAEVLKEDIWLKAIDLQNCGISNIGAKYVLSMLDINVTLYIVDVRDNAKIDHGLVHQIMLKLLYNNAKKEAREYFWTEPQTQFHLVASESLKKRADCTQIPMKRISHCTRQKSNIRSSTSVSTGLIQNHTSLIQYLPQMVETKAKLQEVAEHLEIETSLRRKAELEKEELRTKIHELENELLKEKEEKEGYCFVKTEAFEAILETLEKFSVFVEHVKQANDSNYQDIHCDKVKLNNDMKTFLENHVKSIIKEIAQEEQHKLCRYLQNFPQEMAISLTVTEKEMLQTDHLNKSREKFEQNKTCFTSREDRNEYSIFKDTRSKLKMQCDPIVSPVCSYSSLMVHDVANISKNSSVPDVQNNSSSSFPFSKVKELYEQLIEHSENKKV